MSSPTPEVLTAQLRKAIGGRSVRAAVFTTFPFDPEFFELFVLPALFERAWSRDPNVRRAQLEEALRDVDNVAVYYDRGQFDGGLVGLDYTRFGVARRTGCFHAKHLLLLVERPPSSSAGPVRGEHALLVVTTSANLTRSGWWENVEAAQIEEIRAGVPHPMRSALLDDGGARGLVRRIREHDRTEVAHSALDAIRDFLLRDVPTGTAPGPVLWAGRGTFAAFLAAHVRPGLRLEIVAPYVEDIEAAPTLGRLLDAVRPAETRIHLPIDKDAHAAVSEAYARAVAALPGVSWGELPAALTHWTKEAGGGHRFTHAKVYRFFDDRREVLVVGSVNLSAAAHSDASAGNFESAVLVETVANARRDWWMSRRNTLPEHFAPRVGEEEAVRGRAPPLHLRYDWRTDLLAYFWEPGEAAAAAVDVSTGAVGFRITPIVVGVWVPVPPEVVLGLRDRLRASACVSVTIELETFRVLVREEGMQNRPPLVCDLTPEQILEYWALLSQEQRDAFLEQHGYRLPQLSEDGAPPAPTAVEGSGTTLFDRFAGIFHAFSCLREHVQNALQSGRKKEAAYRLLGRKHDSLGALVERVLDDELGDLTSRYVQLLCAREVTDAVLAAHPAWAAEHSVAVVELRARLDRVAELRARLCLPEDGAAFIEWFEGEFFGRPEVSA
ncbi:MAG: hypothetical protein V4850_17810 [Myxococcota bacterium]